MTFRAQVNNKSWNDSKQIFFTPKLSLEGRNLFPQISEVHAFHSIRDQPFLNILKKPIMSLYDRVQVRSEKKPVCIVGMPKEVQIRHVRTGNMKKNRREAVQSSFKKETLPSFSPQLSKTEEEISTSQSKQLVPISRQHPQGSHFYVLGSGNNRQIVEAVLKKRQGWFPTSSSIFHLRWEQARPKFQNMSAPHRQLINHLPGHQVISDKGNLLTQLKLYCQKNQEYMYKMVPASFIVQFGKEDLEEELKKFIHFYYDCLSKQEINPEREEDQTNTVRSSSRKRPVNDFIIDSPKKIVGKNVGKYSPLKMTKSVVCTEGNKRKQQIKNLYKTLISYLKPFNSFQDMSAPKRQSQWVTIEPDQIYGESSLWLLKPSDLNRGRGIRLFRTIQELGELLRNFLLKHQGNNFIIQKYIEKPLLICGRKFDIRVWALMTHNRDLYFFKEGYIRLSSKAFTLDSSSLLTHLTNNAVQKHATNYGQFEEGNILPLSYLYEEGYMQKQDLYSTIKKNIVHSIKAAGSKLFNPTEKHQSISVGNTGAPKTQSKLKYFQILGYDFMVDANGHFWLIQVNTNPSLEIENQWLKSIVPRMLDDAFKLTIDRAFPIKKTGKEVEGYNVEGYSDEINMWELLEMSNGGESSPTLV